MNLKIYLVSILLLITTITLNGQNDTCSTIQPFCAGNETLVFQNTFNGSRAETGPNYGCLMDQPNPAWFFLQIDQAGILNFQLEQNTNRNFTGTGIDVDFIAYGPFTDINACDNLTAQNTVACSFSPQAVENFTINGQAGEIYIVLITNFDGLPGFIRLGQTNANDTNAGSTDCSIVNGISACEGEVVSLDATANNATRYQWTRDGVLIAETESILNNVIFPSALYVSTAFSAMGDIILTNEFEVVFNATPLANPINDILQCDNDNDGFFSFNFETLNLEVLGAQDPDSFTITYHMSNDDSMTGDNAIESPFINTVNPQTIYARIENRLNINCFDTTSFDLIVISSLLMPDPITICSNQVETIYDLTIREDQIIGESTFLSLTYFESQLDLDNNNPIINPDNYLNTLLNREILVLGTGGNACFFTTILTLETILFPELNLMPNIIEECEVDDNGFDVFDITRREIEILNGLDRADFTITYYENEANAIAGNINNIQDIINFENTQAVTQTIFVRVALLETPCFIVIPLTLLVNLVQGIGVEEEYVLCLSPEGTSIPATLTTFLQNPPIDTQLNPNQYTFQWFLGTDANPLNVIVGETDPAFTPNTPNQYTVVATDITSGCSILVTTNVVGSFPPESIIAEVITDAFSDNNIIEVTVVGNGEYEYSLDGITWQSSPRFENLEPGEYMVFVRDLLNCNRLESNTVMVVDFPKFFTPNNDGINDTWNITGIPELENSIIFIYDRYGKLMRQLDPDGLGWDGSFNGELLPANDYWFTIDFNDPRNGGIRKQFKAHFALKR